MDETFQLNGRRRLGNGRAAALDFSMLTAVLAAQRAAGAAGPARERAPLQAPGEGDPLTEILLAGPDWQGAASAQRGCFNRAEVKRRGNLS